MSTRGKRCPNCPSPGLTKGRVAFSGKQGLKAKAPAPHPINGKWVQLYGRVLG